MSISILIPTYNRAKKFETCLASIANQTIAPDQVIVSYREDDQPTIKVINNYQSILPITVAKVTMPGVVHAENIALKKVTSSHIAFIDDDGIAPTDWIERITKTFESDKNIIGVGGPDYIFSQPELRRDVKRIGNVTWFGKVIGNHHHRAPTQNVMALKGVNMAFRYDDQMSLDPILNGAHSEGNGVFWELDFCLQCDGSLVYDSSIEVRHDSNHSHVLTYPTVFNGAHNLIYVLCKHFPIPRLLIFLTYYFFIGNTQVMGIARSTADLIKLKPLHTLKHLYYSQKGLIKGVLSFIKNR